MGWLWVTWHWHTWHGKDFDYSVQHLVDPTRSDENQATTACGLTVGRVASQLNSDNPPPKGACKKCVTIWRNRTDLTFPD